MRSWTLSPGQGGTGPERTEPSVEQDRSRRFVPGPHEREQSVQLPQEDHTEHTPARNRVNTTKKNLEPLIFASRYTKFSNYVSYSYLYYLFYYFRTFRKSSAESQFRDKILSSFSLLQKGIKIRLETLLTFAIQ